MPRKRTEPRPGQIGDYWLSKKPGRDAATDPWCRTWYDARSRQTCRVSLGESDFSAASTQLAEWVVLNSERRNADPRDVLIDEVLLRYWDKHAKHLPSADTAFLDLAAWTEHWSGRTVAEITPAEQERFRAWLPTRDGARDLGPGGIDRILSTGRAALNRAVKLQELASAPFIFMMQTALDRRARPPMGRPGTLDEIAAFLDAVRSRHLFMFTLVTCCTLFRDAATLELTEPQVDLEHWLVDGNPPGRVQTIKHRPILPVIPTLRPWLRGTAAGDGRHYVTYRNRPIESIDHSWALTVEAAGIAPGFTPYSIRHGLAREMRKRRVPSEQLSLWMGHLPRGEAATTAVYAPYEPDYLAEAAEALEDALGAIRARLKRATMERPAAVSAIDPLAPIDMTGRANRRGIGEQKREEIRRLILTEVPHRQVKQLTGASDGTISAIRQQLKAQGPLYRATEPPRCVPLACRDGMDEPKPMGEPREKAGGPGRIRTCDNTVMSGRRRTEQPQKSAIFLLKR